MAIGVGSPKDLTDISDITEDVAVKIINEARKYADVGNFETEEQIKLHFHIQHCSGIYFSHMLFP